MNREVTSEEIKRAIFQMGPDKVSSPDVCPLSFFQRFWDVVGESVIQFVKEAFRRGTIPEEMNKVAIFLLPKIEETESLSKFRPIALCNVLIKIISKVLASRLQSVMHKLTGKFQSSFISGRLTTNNIITAQESILGQKIERVVEAKQWMPIRLTKNGKPLSHLLFADDLTLFGLASFSQARLTEHIMSNFCDLSE